MKRRIRNLALLAVAFTMMLGLTPLASADPVECEMLAFSLTASGQTKHAVIDNAAEPGLVTIVAPDGVDLKTQKLIPEITLPLGASVSPPAGEPQDFSQLVRYTVSIWDSEQPQSREYLVRVTPGKSETKRALNSFSLLGCEGIVNELNKTILVDVPAGTDLSAAAPVISHNGESIFPAPETKQDFAVPVSYTVTLANGEKETYTVLVEFLEAG